MGVTAFVCGKIASIRGLVCWAVSEPQKWILSCMSRCLLISSQAKGNLFLFDRTLGRNCFWEWRENQKNLNSVIVFRFPKNKCVLENGDAHALLRISMPHLFVHKQTKFVRFTRFSVRIVSFLYLILKWLDETPDIKRTFILIELEPVPGVYSMSLGSNVSANTKLLHFRLPAQYVATPLYDPLFVERHAGILITGNFVVR